MNILGLNSGERGRQMCLQMFLLASHVIWGFINGLQGVIRSLNLSREGKQSEVSYFGKWMKNNCEGAWRGCPLSAAWMWMWLAEHPRCMKCD